MSRPRLLDLCGGAGGASAGYDQAGFEVTGVDVTPQANYPFSFVLADAVEFLDDVLDWARRGIHRFDVISASPPCQAYSAMSSCRPGLSGEYPRLIEPLRERLLAWGGPYVIENVPGAPLIDPVELCGTMFGLELYRHRLFESNIPLVAPAHPPHTMPASRAGHWKPGTVMSVAGHVAPVAHARRIMGIDWTTREELAEAVPPSYTRWIGSQLIASLERVA